jgi:tyrosinase
MTTTEPQLPASLIGAAPAVVLDAPVKTADVSLRPQAAQAARARLAAARPARAFLNLEHVTGAGTLPKYDVFIDAPSLAQGSTPASPVFAGSLSLFGVQRASRSGGAQGGSGITTVLEITDALEQLRRTRGWDESGLRVTFRRRERPGQPAPTGNLQVGRVSVYYG